MTLLVACVASMLSATLCLFTADIAHVVSARAQAQAAADAAALAAAAESSIYGRGDPETAARRFARLNGGELRACLCEPGATAAQVEVAVGVVTARARAIMDPDRVMPADVGRLQPLLATSVQRLLAAARGAVVVASAYRSHAEQEALWAEALAKYGDPEIADDWVARPGTSRHELGLAVDLDGDLALAGRLVAGLGLPLWDPLPNEPWHFEVLER